MTSTPELTPTRLIVANQWNESQGLLPGNYDAFLQRMMTGAEQERARLSSMPFYANKAKKWAAERGDEMGYWRSLFTSHINMVIPPKVSSTAEAGLLVLDASRCDTSPPVSSANPESLP